MKNISIFDDIVNTQLGEEFNCVLSEIPKEKEIIAIERARNFLAQKLATQSGIDVVDTFLGSIEPEDEYASNFLLLVYYEIEKVIKDALSELNNREKELKEN